MNSPAGCKVTAATPARLGSVLPTWLESNAAVEAGEATPLHRFIALYEPASAELRDSFRTGLAAVLGASASPALSE